jgi:hypothetical protein
MGEDLTQVLSTLLQRAYRWTMEVGLLDSPRGGLLAVALVTLLVGAVVGAVLYQHELAALFRRLAHRVRPPPEPPGGLPIERIARDARRLRAQMTSSGRGTSMARRTGTWQAYDELLAEACRALDIPDTLTGMPPGTEREAERLLVEHRLMEAGLQLRG